MHVFTNDWICKLRAHCNSRPEYEWPLVYSVATADQYGAQRAEIEQWIAHLPKASQDKLIPKLQSEQFVETYHELVVWNILRERGFSPEYEKQLNQLTPDWYVPAGHRTPAFVVEVFTANPSDAARARRQHIEDLHCRIAAISFGAAVGFDPSEAQCEFTPQNNKRIAAALRDWFECSDPPVGAEKDLEGMTFRIDERKPSYRTVQLHYPLEAAFVDQGLLSRKIEAKVDRYKSVAVAGGLPFVVAIIPDFFTGLGLWALLSVLYGVHTMNEVLGKSPREISECPPAEPREGLFWRARALSVAAWIDKDNNGQWTIVAYHNPVATNPLPIDALDGM
jgi:hypothetical protein